MERTRTFMMNEAPDYNSGFWRFAKSLNIAAAAKWNDSNQQFRDPLRHIAWTNICKIGVLGVKPPRQSGALFTKQRKLAVETLRLEISSYKPELICFATGDYAEDDVLGESICDPGHQLWDENVNTSGVWFRRPKRGFPPIVWIGHPGRISIARRDIWLKQISELLPT
jgi:hypothetical protein